MTTQELTLSGRSLIGSQLGETRGRAFHGVNPSNGEKLEPAFYSATEEDIDKAANLAADAFRTGQGLSGKERAAFLRRVAENLEAEGEAITQRANLESGLPMPRLQGELKRTTGQLRLFAELLEEGSWVNARIDEGDRNVKPPRPDVRSMLRGLGPVAVFGASNFPLAFSVAGGDTASALAAGNPVVVKGHPAHPGTSELVGRAIRKTVEQSSLPEGMFSLLLDSGTQVGVGLVEHPAIKAVAFTGSQAGGRALMKLAAQRPEPIPCYAEMGSTNPFFILSSAMRERGAKIAHGLQASFTVGSGQFCTKPGLVFLPEDQRGEFEKELQEGVGKMEPFGMLTHGIAARYTQSVRQRIAAGKVQVVAEKRGNGNPAAAQGEPAVFGISLPEFLANPELSEEVFGPTTLLVHYGSEGELLKAAHRLEGHLTATIHGTDEDLTRSQELIRVLETKVGRIVFNGFPTGVEVNHAMVHGGPFPATSDSRSTSVGSMAIWRFVRPVCYQDFPDAALPVELQNANSLGIMRTVNGKLTRD
ncbi:MAG TPA: aldehyde dehydrogenase (NADP(+)) [Terriglobales bacterium]|jgi:NADP-dependent aldehyde dehydrogenase|nr:aldehyde dehydrogenase (NADP(+)) [Terriglobales bacterium]